MRIWVDADACPGAIKEILYRAAERTGVEVVLVANQALRVPRSPHVRAVQVERGFDVADAEIARRAGPGDVVVTSDVPLAAEIVARGAVALTPRGEILDAENVRARLGMRDFLDTMRASGFDTGGPPALGAAERKAFAGHLDRLLARRDREPSGRRGGARR